MAEEEADVGKAITTIISALKPLDSSAQVQVLKFVIEHLDIAVASVQPAAPAGGPTGGQQPAGTGAAAQNDVVDIRAFAKDKQPKTVSEKVALVAYYLANVAQGDHRRDSIGSEDLHPNFDQADFEMPNTSPQMMLANAKNAGYLNALGKGRYRLNPVGFNLIKHKLPADGDAAKTKRRPAARKVKAKRPKSRR
jgi:hypothetical protein